VAQCVESYVSKLFSCSYSSATILVLSGNPADHLVHRMAHRTVRGCLFACGRPDGRLAALSALEVATCRSINQIVSTISKTSGCECLTIGHNPHKLALSKYDIFLQDIRKRYLCEFMHEKVIGQQLKGLKGQGEDCETLLHSYAAMRREVLLNGGLATMDGWDSKANLRPRIPKKIDAGVRHNTTYPKEKYFGENIEQQFNGISTLQIVEEQTLSMRLYETRIASLQRMVAFYVLFYQMAKDVQVVNEQRSLLALNFLAMNHLPS
jgi:hypothetical protein